MRVAITGLYLQAYSPTFYLPNNHFFKNNTIDKEESQPHTHTKTQKNTSTHTHSQTKTPTHTHSHTHTHTQTLAHLFDDFPRIFLYSNCRLLLFSCFHLTRWLVIFQRRECRLSLKIPHTHILLAV